jgi:hypothetical protein
MGATSAGSAHLRTVADQVRGAGDHYAPAKMLDVAWLPAYLRGGCLAVQALDGWVPEARHEAEAMTKVHDRLQADSPPTFTANQRYRPACRPGWPGSSTAQGPDRSRARALIRRPPTRDQVPSAAASAPAAPSRMATSATLNVAG